MATKQAEIKRLIRKDYGFPVLQRLLAELIYETRNYNKRSLESRYNSLLKILLGNPSKEIKKKGYKDDDELLSRAAVMMHACKKKDPKTGKYLKRFLNLTEACDEIARLVHVKDYKFQTTLPENITEYGLSEIRSTRIRLMEKLKGNVNHYAKMHAKFGMQQTFEYDETIKEVEFIQTLMPDWLQRFGGQIIFHKK